MCTSGGVGSRQVSTRDCIGTYLVDVREEAEEGGRRKGEVTAEARNLVAAYARSVLGDLVADA